MNVGTFMTTVAILTLAFKGSIIIILNSLELIRRRASRLPIKLKTVCKGAQGLYCLSCNDVSQARTCDTLMECGSHEVCYHKLVVNPSGILTRRLGCRDRLQCTSLTSGVGRRTPELTRRSGETMVCDSCCDTDLCQTTLCSDLDFPSPHGPLCFSCSDMLHDNCNKFSVCGRDEVCYESLHDLPGTGELVKVTGCYHRQTCEHIKMALGNLMSSGGCFNCCSDNLCKTNCTMATPPKASVSPVTTCTDSTSLQTCQLAGQYVCVDRDKADHANCLHYCGYC